MGFLTRILVPGLIALLLSGCGQNEEKTPETVIRPVRTMTVAAHKQERMRTFSGVAKAGSISRVSFRVGGKLERIQVKEGDRITRNAFIAVLDDSDARLQVEKGQAALKKSKVYMDTAQSNLLRIRGLYENNNVSLNEYETAKEKLANARAAYQSDKKNLDLNRKELGYFKVYAPISGVVAGVAAETGENVSAGQVILEIHTMDELEVTAGIPDTFIAQVKQQDAVRIVFTPLGKTVFKGKVTKVSFNIDAESSTYPVTIRVLDPSPAIRPGMPATLSFDFSKGSQESVLRVPVQAVGQDGSGHFVYLVKPGGPGVGQVEKRAVTLGQMTNQGFEILTGIRPGDRVVTAGIVHLSPGLEVRVNQDSK